MTEWGADSPRLRENLTAVLRDARDRAVRRDVPTAEDAGRWQRDTMAGLDVPDAKYVGRFRGEPGLETTRVWIGSHEGVPPEEVARDLAAFEETLQRAVAALDARYPQGQELDRDGLAAVIDVCAWTHAGWVRIHPFGYGNGRTARSWANALLIRYGLPPVVRLRDLTAAIAVQVRRPWTVIGDRRQPSFGGCLANRLREPKERTPVYGRLPSRIKSAVAATAQRAAILQGTGGSDRSLHPW